jgi:hypothetical protein
MTEYDIPWKEILDTYLKGFLELCLPEIHNGIDWSNPIENHEQELPHLFPKSLTPGRVADKLFRAQFRTNEQPTWFLIHTEVQVTRQADFAERMFSCYYRILDRFKEPVVCIGILGDSSTSWRPDTWQVDTLGCKVQFSYPIVKLNDFVIKIASLTESPNPFATVIAAHLRAQSTSVSPDTRFRFKIELTRSLYEKQWPAEQVRSLFRFIDWVMDLPEDFELQFRNALQQIEKEKNMPYVTSIERIAKVEGKAEGKAEGKIQLLQELLGLKVMSDEELDAMSPQQLEQLLVSLRQRLDAR